MSVDLADETMRGLDRTGPVATGTGGAVDKRSDSDAREAPIASDRIFMSCEGADVMYVSSLLCTGAPQ